MRISIPATRFTRAIAITVSRNLYKEPAFALYTHDSVFGHGDGLFIFAVRFRPWATPWIVYYNGSRTLTATDFVRIKPWRLI